MQPYEIRVDVKRLSTYGITKLEVKQGDKDSRFVNATITHDGAPLDLTGKTVTFYAEKPDGTKIYNSTTIEDASKGMVGFNLSTQTLAKVGTVKCELVISGADGSKLTSASFNITVLTAVNDETAVESTNEFTQLQEGITKLTQWDNQFQTKYDGLETEYAEDITSVKSQLAEIAINVKNFGVVGDGITDDTLAIKNVLANHKNVYFPEGDYVIQLANTDRNGLHWFTDLQGISIKGKNATIIDKTIYDTETLVNIFGFTNCTDIEIDLNYKGLAVTDPDINLSKLGCSFLYFETNCKNIKINTKIENSRYGVRSGDYLNPLYGYCENFNINMVAKMVGYPLALYLASNVTGNITSDGSVRTTYLAGVENAKIKVSSKNYYKTSIQNLLTNSITTYSDIQSEQRARGCSNINIDVVDEGSEKFIEFSVLIGLALQWVSQGTVFSDINAKYYVKSTNTLSSKVGGFHLSSVAKATRTECPYNWEPYIKINNLKISGIIDRSEQTTATNSSGELFIKAFDEDDTTFEHCPEITNLIFENTVFKKGSIQTTPIYVLVPNLKGIIQMNGLVANGINMIANVQNGKVMINNSVLQTLSIINSINHLALKDSTITSIDFEKVTKLSNSNFDFARAGSHNGIRRLTITTDGSSQYYFTNAIKSNALTKAIIVDIQGYPSTGTIQVGNVSSPTAYGSMPINGSGTTKFVPYYYTAGKFPFMAAESVRVTFVDVPSLPNGVDINLYIFEEEFI